MFMPVDERCQHVERDCVDEVPGERVDPHRLLFAEQKGDSIVAVMRRDSRDGLTQLVDDLPQVGLGGGWG